MTSQSLVHCPSVVIQVPETNQFQLILKDSDALTCSSFLCVHACVSVFLWRLGSPLCTHAGNTGAVTAHPPFSPKPVCCHVFQQADTLMSSDGMIDEHGPAEISLSLCSSAGLVAHCQVWPLHTHTHTQSTARNKKALFNGCRQHRCSYDWWQKPYQICNCGDIIYHY